MVFGRKKKQEQEKAVVEDAPANEEADLAVAYGTGDEVKDDVSLTDSVPPPPPGKVTDMKNEDLSQEESPTESPSVGAVDDVDDSTDDKKADEQVKRKKLILIVSCIISFFILLGLAIKYGQVRSEAAKKSEAALDSTATESLSTPAPTIVQVLETASPTTNTQAPTEFDPFAKCEANGISVLTSCTDTGGASATFNLCLVEDLSDQFWEFVSTPPRVPQVIANDWAWLRDAASAEIPFLPEGTYEVGLFSNGEQNLQQYPLMNSTVFTVDCSQE